MASPYRAHPLSPEVEWYLDSRGLALEDWQRPLWRTPEPGEETGARFNPSRVDRLLTFMRRNLVHTQGALAWQPLEPSPWQVAYILAMLGWEVRNEDGEWVRYFRRLFVEIPRKQGKTTLSAAIMLYLAFADGEPSAQVLLGAMNRDQARLAFDPLRLIVQKSSTFPRLGIRGTRSHIERAGDASVIKPVVGDGAALQGTNPHGWLVDEVHTLKNMDLIDAFEAGTGARRQPLGFIITTADGGGRHTPYAILHKELESQAQQDECDGTRHYAVVFGAPKSANIHSEDTWRRANPGLGVSPSYDFMRGASADAKTSPEARTKFCRYNLNIQINAKGEFISRKAWDRNRVGSLDPRDFEGRPCVGGIDLAAVKDLTSFCLLFPDEDGEAVTAFWHYWTPEANLPSLDKRTNSQATQWAEQGLLTVTEGNVQDYNTIKDTVMDAYEAFDIVSIGCDPWNWASLIPELVAEGVPFVKVRQGTVTMSPAMNEIQRLVYMPGAGGPAMLRHNNPISDWCVGNLEVARDTSGNVKPDKRGSRDKIDGFAAMATAMTELLAKWGDCRDRDDVLSGISVL